MPESSARAKHIGIRSVITALVSNVLVGIFKFIAFIFTGSAVMLSEAIHSIADTTNQAFLVIGIKRSQKPANEKHNYGYSSERFFWSLLSACGVFFLGAGVTIYHGITVILHDEPIHFSFWIIAVLLFSFLLEGYSLFTAASELRKLADGEPILKYAKHSGDPTLLAVIYEDSAALIGILLALVATVLTWYTGQVYWDGVGSILIGILLAVVATLLMNINRELLVGRAIPKHLQKKIYTILLNQKVVDEVHDFKTVMIATDGYRVKAEVEVNGHYLADKIFESHDFHDDYENIKDYDDFIRFCSHFSDKVTRTLGKEIDLLEKEVEHEVPTVKHIDIESN